MTNQSFLGEWTIYDEHKVGHTDPTVPQIALCWIWVICLFLYLIRMAKHRSKMSRQEAVLAAENEKNLTNENPGETVVEIGADSADKSSGVAVSKVVNGGKTVDVPVAKNFTKVKPPPDFNAFLLYVVQLGIIMLFFYYSDYIKVFPRSERVYSRDTFLFVVFLLFLVGCAFTTRTTDAKILNRDQTEEWKGWMQVLFVWYHYFAAAEWYNWIRIYIAAYVWMTGFGNFSFFYIRKDFTIWRALKMLFRLNFLVLVICAAVSNPYMLYYICPMHTYWFLSVYALMAIFPSWNQDRVKMPFKFAIYAIVNAIIFEIPGFSETVFYPGWPVLGFQMGKWGIMHEWSFRLGLDHWACFIGMICAYNYPYFEEFMKRIEKHCASMSERTREVLIKVAISVPVLLAFLLWHGFVMGLVDKFAYNKLHPYLSFVPILAFIWFRNLFPIFRTHYIHLFAELGKITLETYLSQLHAYLQSNAKELLSYISGYPMLNFSFSTIVYLGISHTLFALTQDISAYLLPQDSKLLRWRILCTIVTLVLAFTLGLFSKVYLWALVSYI